MRPEGAVRSRPMDDILEDAKRLGGRLAAHARTKALKEATAAVEGDPAAKTLEEDYARATAELHALEEENRPIEPEMKRKIVDLQSRIRRSDVLQRLLRAHADFAEMMDAVQRTIGGLVDQALVGDGGGEGPAPEAGGGEPPPEPEPGKGRILWTP